VRTVFDLGTRPMSDVDLLVPARRWRAAIEAIVAAGATWHDAMDRPLTLRLDYAAPLRTPEGVIVEVHRSLVARPLFAVDHEGLFSRARPVGDGLSCPDPTDLFLHLGLHAAKHAYDVPLRALVDGLRLAEAGAVDPQEVAVRARAWQARRATALWLWILLDLGLPEAAWVDVARSLAPRASVASLLAGAPRREVHGPRRWWLVARSLDHPLRALAYLAQRTGLRALDAAAAVARR
jgi:hypothetical protein